MDGKAKENANPVVHQIDQGRAKKHVEWCPLDSWNFSATTTDDDRSQLPILRLPVQRLHTAEDRIIHTALLEISKATEGQGVSLLADAGLTLQDAASPDASQPNFLTPTTPPRPRIQARETYTADEIFDIIRNIQDPEHPLTLAQLNVVNRHHITVHDNYPAMSTVHVRFTPTIPHCSMATLIGLSIRVKLLRSLPTRFKVKVEIQPGTHASEAAVGKQLADKERVCAALENQHLLGVVNKCIGDGMNICN
jgi:metal-sulfur cluster biosynthetic enzyme